MPNYLQTNIPDINNFNKVINIETIRHKPIMDEGGKYMSLTDQNENSWNCQRCDFEMVEIEKDTIEKIIEILNPNFLSLPNDWKSKNNEWIKICPRCDKFSLGFKMEHVFPIRTNTGEATTINDLDFVKAHKHTEYQKEILKGEKCGCFYCLENFSPDEINDWHGEDCKDYEPLALCPKCGIDSVIGSASGYPIEHSFLKKMKDFWFSPSELNETMGDDWKDS